MGDAEPDTTGAGEPAASLSLRDAAHLALVLLQAEYDELLHVCCKRDLFGKPIRQSACRADADHLSEFETVIDALAAALVQERKTPT